MTYYTRLKMYGSDKSALLELTADTNLYNSINYMILTVRKPSIRKKINDKFWILKS